MKSGITIGNKLRTLRKAKGITINEVARQTQLTPSFISQFERDLTSASVYSIQKITGVLGMTLSDLFHGDEPVDELPDAPHIQELERGPTLIRKTQRKKIVYSKGNVDYLLTGLGGHLEVLFSEIEPGSGSGELYAHESEEECVVVLRGRLEIYVQDATFILGEGDSISFCSRLLHGWKNIGDTVVEAIWIITPPTF